MTRSQKVLWTEGLLLTPHHFQQWDRYYEGLVHSRIRNLSIFGWGIENLEINTEALQSGIFEILRCRAVFPDGLTIDIPEADAQPPTRDFTSIYTPEMERLGVYIGIPVLRQGFANLDMEGDAPDSMARYRPGEISLPDEYTGDNPQTLALAAKNLRILFGEDETQNHTAIKIAELNRNNEGKAALNNDYIPPSLCISASKTLTDMIRRLSEMLTAKSATLSGQRRQQKQDMAHFTTSDVAGFWLLHTVNSYTPLLMHLYRIPQSHPEQAYMAMARLAAELMTFVTEGNPAELPQYSHSDPTNTFRELDRKLSVLLETVIPTRCVPIPLERTKESLFVGRIQDDQLLTGAEFYLAVSAKMPEAQLIERVPRKSKIASLDTINYLLGQALPGIALRPVPSPPGPIPVRMGFKYFRLEKMGNYWNTVSASRNICLHFPAEFPELKLELYAVKD